MAAIRKFIGSAVYSCQLMLFVLLAISGCGSDEPQTPGAQLKPGAISRKTAIMADRLDKRLQQPRHHHPREEIPVFTAGASSASARSRSHASE